MIMFTVWLWNAVVNNDSVYCVGVECTSKKLSNSLILKTFSGFVWSLFVHSIDGFL